MRLQNKKYTKQIKGSNAYSLDDKKVIWKIDKKSYADWLSSTKIDDKVSDNVIMGNFILRLFYNNFLPSLYHNDYIILNDFMLDENLRNTAKKVNLSYEGVRLRRLFLFSKFRNVLYDKSRNDSGIKNLFRETQS